ncbi:MAG: hypothetical protein FWH05_09220, partial [Oscillospiraceae bacterium]|nr:hypothetical protein [Oscillospiraceae bacterium]
ETQEELDMLEQTGIAPIQNAVQVIRDMSADTQMQERARMREEALINEWLIEGARKMEMQKLREEGQKLREEGMQEGMQKGRQEGMEKGRKEGIQKGAEGILNLLRERGMSEVEIKELMKGMRL